jgi:sugar-phosphatase
LAIQLWCNNRSVEDLPRQIEVGFSEPPMTQITCSGLLLDMDGVLVDSTPAVARVWTRWAIKHNLDPDHTVHFAHGRPSLASVQELLSHADPAVHFAENAWLERAEIEDVADIVALPGSRELLSTVPSDRFAVVTSATRALAEVRLRAAGLWSHIRNLVSSDDIRHGKPDPEPYLKGAAILRHPAEDCVVIEDAPSGTRSGKAAGARVLALRTTTDDAALIAAGADWIGNDCSSIRLLPNAPAGRLHINILEDPANCRTPQMR